MRLSTLVRGVKVLQALRRFTFNVNVELLICILNCFNMDLKLCSDFI